MKSIFIFLVIVGLGFYESTSVAGQNGNGGFVYKDKKRVERAYAIMNEGKEELFNKVNSTPESVFLNLKHPLDRDVFMTIVDKVYYMSNMSGFRIVNNKVEILMMDYNDCGDGLLGKCITVYAPMIVAMMFMEDQFAAKKFFQIELIHEALHYFSFSEDEAESTAPLLYEKIFQVQ